mgnify:CR=1 FL=1
MRTVAEFQIQYLRQVSPQGRPLDDLPAFAADDQELLKMTRAGGEFSQAQTALAAKFRLFEFGRWPVSITGSSFNLFAERFTERNFFGFEHPASWYQSLNPAYIIIFAPFFSWFWIALAKRNLEPSIPGKFALAMFQIALGFAIGAVLGLLPWQAADPDASVLGFNLAWFLVLGALVVIRCSLATRTSLRSVAARLFGLPCLPSPGSPTCITSWTAPTPWPASRPSK